MYLAVRTDQPEATISLLDKEEVVNSQTWLAHRQLSLQLLPKITELLINSDSQLGDLKGIIYFSGPGSFTGLRIGASVVNALAYSLNIPVVPSSSEAWIKKGLAKIKKSPQKLITKLDYQSPPHITQPRK